MAEVQSADCSPAARRYTCAVILPDQLQTADISRVIELAVAPVFLLTGIAALLSMLTGRIARIIDRARALEAQFDHAEPEHAAMLRTNLRRLATRARAVNWAVSMITTAAVHVGLVVVLLFIGALVGIDVAATVAGLFIAAMAGLIAGLLCFLREVYLATRYVRIGVPEAPEVESRMRSRAER